MGEELSCKRELGNDKDRYAVAVVLRDSTTVGHVPRKISAACALFLERDGSIDCVVTGEHCYSRDLPQGGLEVPCLLKFKGQPKYMSKIKKLLAPAGTTNDEEPAVQPPAKRSKSDMDPVVIRDDKISEDGVGDKGPRNIWLSDPVSHIELSHKDRSALTIGDCLNDNHINFAQVLLKRQFKSLSGLQSTLWLTKLKEPLPATGSVQVLHTRGNHWIVASTVGCSAGDVNVFDSLYTSVDAAKQLA